MSSQRSKRRRVQEELYTYTNLPNFTFESENPEQLLLETHTDTPICQSSLQPDKLTLECPNNDSVFSPTQIYTGHEHLEPNNLTSPNIQMNFETDNNYDLPNNAATENTFSISDMISKWAINYNISHCAVNGLLLGLRNHKCFANLPKDARTILRTKSIDMSNMRVVTPGQYYHFGLRNEIERHFLFKDNSTNEIQLVIGIDGLPIAKSTTSQFWPILGYIRPYSGNVFPIGIYLGMEKPHDSNDLLQDFVNEAKILLKDGIIINNKIYTIVFDVFCCDVPAKSFILKIKGHCGYFSCTRCRIEGEHKDSRICFPYNEANLVNVRTHNDYVQRIQEDHHVSSNISCLAELTRFDVVSNFSLDYMHLVCLGTVKKLILLWMKGPLNVRLPSWKINEISENSVKLKTSFPCEFSRKPRKLDEISRWKATELRSFLLYIGPIVLKKTLSDDCFKHFMSLNISMIILLSSDHSTYVDYAKDLLKYFVKTFETIYGRYLISHNIHGLLHLTEDFRLYGQLDNCSAFVFENYMQTLKSMLRKPDKPLEQIVLRYHERGQIIYNPKNNNNITLLGPHDNGPLLDNMRVDSQYNTLKLPNFKFKTKINADSYYLSKKKEIVKLINITYSKDTDKIILIGKKFEHKEDFYDQPISSSHFGIYVVKHMSTNLSCWSITDIHKKVMIFSIEDGRLVALPFLHSN